MGATDRDPASEAVREGAPSKTVIRLHKAHLGIVVDRENLLHHLAAARITVIQTQRKRARELIVPAHVVERRQARGSVRWAAVEAECPRLKRAAAGIPKIVIVSQPQSVYV